MMDSGKIIRVENRRKIRIMRNILLIGVFIAFAKFTAWRLTASNAILTDALESIINIAAATFGLLTLVYSARPKDENHPYGHGKAEFLAVGFEGALILLAGGGMIVKAVMQFFEPPVLHEIESGILISCAAGLINFLMGRYLIKKGKSLNSSTLVADGKHLISDTVSSVALAGGLVIILLTGLFILDSILTIILGTYILVVGYKLVRNSMAGLMDEADFGILDDVIRVLNRERKPAWVDIHNLRVIKYGSSIHIDAHLTLPWYYNLEATHREVKEVEAIVRGEFGGRVELFIHTDPCQPSSCAICILPDCKERKQDLVRKLEWEAKNLLENKPHSVRQIPPEPCSIDSDF